MRSVKKTQLSFFISVSVTLLDLRVGNVEAYGAALRSPGCVAVVVFGDAFFSKSWVYERFFFLTNE